MKNKYETHGDVTAVFDAKGRTFLIDTKMIETVGQHKWFVDIDKNRVCMTTTHKSLHRYLLGDDCESIDHINRDRLDNRLSNLRACTVQENNFNRGVSKNNKLGIKGVCFDKYKGKYKATIGHNNKKYHIGYYDTVDEAKKAYDEQARKIFGDYSPIVDIK